MLFAGILGAVFGFISAVPVAGPISALIFSYGMRGKYSKGRWIAVGAGFAEACYTGLAFWGFTHFLHDLTVVFAAAKFIAGVLLIILGVYFFRSKKMRALQVRSSKSNSDRRNSVLVGAGMSFVNPTLIATWTATITTMYGLQPFKFTTVNNTFFSLGVWAGIVAWFTLMLKWMEKHRNAIEPKVLDRALKVIGVFLILLAIWLMFKSYEAIDPVLN
ncbi:MAG: LysE family transporter [Bdellovibrionales bacterium]|nr:LysE family transporter [Bdellovibrionales bacterium]